MAPTERELVIEFVQSKARFCAARKGATGQGLEYAEMARMYNTLAEDIARGFHLPDTLTAQ